jgi:hypothetical protein
VAGRGWVRNDHSGIHPDTRAELAAGAGGELDWIHSLRSSTALGSVQAPKSVTGFVESSMIDHGELIATRGSRP